MAISDDIRASRISIWRHRGLRFLRSIHVLISISLAVLLLGMVNYLASQYHARRDLSWQKYYGLGDKTKSLLASLKGEVEVVSFARRSHPLYNDVKYLLKEYEYQAAGIDGLKLHVVMVDPDRDLVRTRELAGRYEITEPNVVVFEMGGRRKYVDVSQIAQNEYKLEGAAATKKMVGFRGEEAFSSALQSVSQGKSPVVYFLKGHGERDLVDFNPNSGYSRVGTLMHRDNIELKPLLLAERQRVPEDCSALVIAGPERRFATAEVDLIKDYLTKSGRVLLMVDSGAATGLEDLVASWGLRLATDVVVDPSRTLTGRELFVAQYGDHPVTRRLNNLAVVFYAPRSVTPVTPVTPAGGAEAQPDRPRVTVLASSTAQGWSDANPSASPVQFDKGIDQPGPVPVAAAVEKGAIGGIDVQIRPTRLIVIGDADFVSNGALNAGVGGNVDFFLSCLNWLLEREALMTIQPKPPYELRLDMTSHELRKAVIILILGWPVFMSLVGLGVWWRRRY